jgi:hypothetical protein
VAFSQAPIKKMNQREIKHKAKHVLEAHLQCAAAQS